MPETFQQEPEPRIYMGANGEDDTPHPGEHELWSWLENLANESSRVRREEAKFDLFDRWLDLYYGNHWPTSTPSYKPPVVINELRTLILSEASDLSDNDFRPYVLKDPHKPGRDEDVERALRAVWVREQIPLKLIYAAVWALICGTGFLRVQWDPDANHGLGDVIVDDIDPRYVLPDPDAIDDRKWQFVMVENAMDITEIQRLFPISGMRIKPEDKWSVRDKYSSNAPDSISYPSYLGPLSDSTLVGRSTYGYKKARARVLDCLVNDPTSERVIEPVRDSKTNQLQVDENGHALMQEIVKPKYPRGRRIVGANGVILFDGPNPNPGGDFGMVRVILEPALGRFWSHGFVQQTAELQIAANKLMSQVVENAIRLNQGMIVATTNTGLDFETFSSIPGQIVQINQGSEFKVVYPPPMPPDMVQAPQRLLDMQKRILGFEGSRGGGPSRGNTSSDMSETEISQAQGPTRLRGRLLYASVQHLAELIFARMAWGYLTERVIPSVEGEKFKPVVWKPLEQPDKYSLYVDPAAFQIMSRTMLRKMGLALYRLKAIDRESLLSTIAWPDWERTSQRMGQAEQQAMQMKMMMKGGGKK